MNRTEQNAEVCEYLHVHEDLVKQVQKEMPPEELLYDLAELFKVFGDTTRIKILFVLFRSELCVCDIATLLNMTQSAISHQLRILKQMDLVKSRRDGKTIFYSLADSHIQTIIGQGMEHVCEDLPEEETYSISPEMEPDREAHEPAGKAPDRELHESAGKAPDREKLSGEKKKDRSKGKNKKQKKNK